MGVEPGLIRFLPARFRWLLSGSYSSTIANGSSSPTVAGQRITECAQLRCDADQPTWREVPAG